MINEQALKDRLKKIAQEKNININVCWKQFLLERFLVRLAHSAHADKFIFKGGFLLAYHLQIGRETIDLDFLLTQMKAEKNKLQKVLEQIISLPLNDGFNFSLDSIELLNHPHMDYQGYRVVLNTAFSKMKDKIQVDVGIGDIVEPLIKDIPLVKYKNIPLFESFVSLLVYPLETIFAEKFETIISKGVSNSRMKDYHDLILMLRGKHILDSDKLKYAIKKTFSHRKTVLKPIEFEESSIKHIQKFWSAHLRGLGNNAVNYNLPKNIPEVIKEINQYIFSLKIDFVM